MRLALFALLIAPAALAQTPARRDTLPPLSPRDIEIRGELRVSLPSIERQPLTAFGLAPAVRRVDARRTVAFPAYVTPVIPPSTLGAPVLPELVSLDPGVPRRGTFEAGVGRHYARFAHAYFTRPLAPGTSLVADGTYEGLSGFRPEGLPETGADAGRLALGVRHAQGTTALAATLDLEGAAQGLYGAGLFKRRTGITGGIGAEADGVVNARGLEGARVGGGFRLSTGRFDPDGFDSRESHLDAAFRAEADHPAAGLWLGADVRAGRLDGAARVGQLALSAGAGVALRHGEGTLRVGPRVLVADEAVRRTALTLDLDGRYRLGPAFSALLVNTPRVLGGRFADVFAESPFSAARPDVRSDVVPVDARAGVAFTRGTTETTVWVGYRKHTQGRFYEQPTGRGLVAVAYAPRGEAVGGVTVRAMQLAGLHALASIEVRDPTFTAPAQRALTVPYRAPFEASLQVGYRLPANQGALQATLRGEGVRYADRAGTVRVPPAADLDLFASYAVTPFVHVVGRLDNVLAGGRERWAGFPEARLLGQVGLSFRW